MHVGVCLCSGKDWGNDLWTIFIILHVVWCVLVQYQSYTPLHTTTLLARSLIRFLSIAIPDCQVLFWPMTWMFRHISLSSNNNVREINKKGSAWVLRSHSVTSIKSRLCVAHTQRNFMVSALQSEKSHFDVMIIQSFIRKRSINNLW